MIDELVIADAVPALAEALGREVGATVVAEPADVLAAGVDGVVIASSTATHPDLIRACVRAGIPTFCEKPVAQSYKEAVALREELADSEVPVQIGFPRRFDPAYVAARDDLLAGRLGYLHTVRSTTLDPAPPPEAYILGSGGIFNDCAIHDFDSIRWATGQEVVEVYAAGSTQGIDYIAAAGDAETATSVLTLSGGTLAVVSNTRANGRGHDVRLELLGSAGLRVRRARRAAAAAIGRRRRSRSPAEEPWELFMDRFADAFRAELTAFTEVVAGTRTSPCTVADARRGRADRGGRHGLLP